MYCLLFTGLALLIWLVRRQLTWRGIGVVATAGGLFGVVLAPLLLPMIQAARTWVSASLFRDPSETLTFSADLLGFVTPQVFHPLWGDWALTQRGLQRYAQRIHCFRRLYGAFLGRYSLNGYTKDNGVAPKQGCSRRLRLRPCLPRPGFGCCRPASLPSWPWGRC